MSRKKQQGSPDFLGSFPVSEYPEMLPNQRRALGLLQDSRRNSLLLELPTGSGKSAIGYTYLRAFQKLGRGPLFYIAPNKTIVDQVTKLHPDTMGVYGRSEYPCLYYVEDKDAIDDDFINILDEDPKALSADDVPCSMLRSCPHRVDQETGKTHEEGAFPCPYLRAKHEAKTGDKIIVTTVSFYLFTQFFSFEWDTPEALVIDEVHRLAGVFRSTLSYEVTDHQIRRSIKMLEEIGADEVVAGLEAFLGRMMQIIRSKPARTPSLLDESEIGSLIDILMGVSSSELETAVAKAMSEGVLDPEKDRVTLKRLEVLIRSIPRYVRGLQYSMAAGDRMPLSYVDAWYTKEKPEENRRVQYKLCIRSYYVRPIIRKVLSNNLLAYSATVGTPEILAFETGISNIPFHSLPSGFPMENTRVFIPNDTLNLAKKSQRRGDLNKTLRLILRTAKRFRERGIRSLAVVISNLEREKMVRFAKEEGVEIVTYGNGVSPREAVERFKSGEGDVLVGTAANYGEGLDLPRSIAPVIFVLRPGYPNPKDPSVQFEEKRFGNRRWGIWNWRVALEALQVRGRNVRSAEDIGVTFFMSKQFRRFLPGAFPGWLQEACVVAKSFEECVEEAEEVLLEVETV